MSEPVGLGLLLAGGLLLIGLGLRTLNRRPRRHRPDGGDGGSFVFVSSSTSDRDGGHHTGHHGEHGGWGGDGGGDGGGGGD